MSAQPADPNLPPDHVSIEIDGRSMAVPKGSMIIAAADKAGIAIPRFCYHEKLPIAANCRMCMVEVEMGGRPMPKPQPACATPVADGMKVFTQSQRALSAQRNVMEFLLINHPLDCPICDQGGECELQDLSMGYGRSVSRFAERKRVIPDENLGPLVQTEMTRCIQCTRCVRVMSEVAGTYELGGMERGERLQIGTYVGKPLMSELSGNVIDVCPVGALTNKPFRFQARPWELIARESIAYHDALGSNLWLHTRRGEVLRTVPRDEESINECWLSDRDRYSHQGLYAADRATKPQVKRNGAWTEVEWDDAIAVAAEALKRHAGTSLGALVHPATSNEEGHLLGRLVRGLGSRSIDHRLRPLDLSDGAAAVPFARPYAEIEQAGVVVLIGCDPRSELPLLNARLRKAVRRGAQVHVIGSLDFDATYPLAGKQVLAPAALVGALLDLAKAANDGGHLPESGALAAAIAGRDAGSDAAALIKRLAEAGSAAIVFGEMATLHPQASVLRAAARFVATATGAAYDEIPPGANAIGLAAHGVLPDGDGLDARAMVATPRKAYLLYGIESAEDLADAAAWRALIDADSVVAFSAFASESLRQVADVILPIGLLPEIDATLVNLDGRAQTVVPGAKLPGQARPGWRVLRALGAALSVPGFDFVEIGELRAQLAPAAPRAVNGRLADMPAPADGLVRIATTAIYRGDAVLRRSTALNAHPLTRGARVALHPQDALALGIGQGGSARIGSVVLPVELTPRVPRGAAWIEAGYAETAGLPSHGAALSIARA
ncbi:MAG TPA: NADH-quinone oxidoreductase subunit NuoG [Dokdonella sp.]|uniref:NADH-quinone oxidoreductase subunit NuoG n=1 Tax=Dokdonella sp. TaxID=2291710 RepID=UPI002C3BD3CB|nr:NADH-quinone oxidoreductase subunit NuoG [Dokdonella sp.]HUD42322.1 NADH-quinone oxidoreductase subunit NuoG [Dokdonella sp.]